MKRQTSQDRSVEYIVNDKAFGTTITFRLSTPTSPRTVVPSMESDPTVLEILNQWIRWRLYPGEIRLTAGDGRVVADDAQWFNVNWLNGNVVSVKRHYHHRPMSHGFEEPFLVVPRRKWGFDARWFCACTIAEVAVATKLESAGVRDAMVGVGWPTELVFRDDPRDPPGVVVRFSDETSAADETMCASRDIYFPYHENIDGVGSVVIRLA